MKVPLDGFVSERFDWRTVYEGLSGGFERRIWFIDEEACVNV